MTSTAPDGILPSTSKGQTDPLKSENLDQASELLKAAIEARELEQKKNAWASWVDSEYTKCKNARAPFERQWFLNIAFLNGRHYLSPIEVAGQGFRLTSPKAPPWRVRLVVNLVRNAHIRECAKLVSGRPIPTVVPATNETEDFSAAKVSEQLVKTSFADAEFEDQYRDWLWWGTATGVSFMKQWWDSSAKDYDAMGPPPPLTLPGSQEPLPPEILSQIPGAEEYMQQLIPAEGKIKRERINPFHIFVPDLLTRRLEGQPYLIQVMTRDPEWVKKAYGLDVVTTDTRASATIMDAAMLITKGSEEHYDAVLVKECWIKPNTHKDFPEGGVVTIVNSKVVQFSETWPCPFPEYPFYKFDGVPTGGFYSDSSIVDLIPLNKEYNRTRSQSIEIKNTMGKPKLVYARGSLNPKQISSEPGQSVPYTPGFEKPQVMQGTEVPASFYQELQVLRGDFDDISGQHEISRGQTPTDVTSGTAIAFLQEQDDSLLTFKVSSIEYALQMMGKHYLLYVSRHWDDDRTVKITGKNQEFETLNWKQNLLKGNTDVRIQSGSALPVSKAARMAMITEWMMNGFLDAATGMEVLEIGDLVKVADEIFADKRQAQRENLKLAQAPEEILTLLMNPAPGPNGEPPTEIEGPEGEKVSLNGDGTPFQPQSPIPVNSWDNHEEHIKWHNQYRKSQEFELLPDPNKQAFELHVQQHQLAITAMLVNTNNQVIQPGQQQEEIQQEVPGEEPPVDEGGQQPPSE